MKFQADVVKNTSRFTVVLAPLGALLAIFGMENFGAMVILFCCVLDRKRVENSNAGSKTPLVLESSLVWIFFTSIGGLDPEEWIQTCCVFGAIFSIHSPSLSILEHRFHASHVLIFSSLSQSILYGLLQGWTVDILITSLLAFSFILHAGLDDFIAGSYWGIFIGFRATIIALGGGVMVNDYLIVDESHRIWIMMLSAPVLGVAIFESLRSGASSPGEP